MSEHYLGLISGTSADGIDAVIAEFEADRFVGLKATHQHHYAPELRARLLQLSIDQPELSMREFCALDAAVGDAFADAALAILAASGVDAGAITAIGSHGQTVFHDGPARLTLQFGDANRIVAATGIATIADFRRIDLALGGQGAPLVPAFHQAVFSKLGEARCVLNLGGIANITVLPGASGRPVRGFDTGPANGLMDEWMQVQRGQPFDANGSFAASGQPIAALVDALLDDPYFALPAPKSTGRDYFRLDWVRRRFPGLALLAPHDVQASLAAVTARSVADAIRAEIPDAARVMVCGGGARNGELMRMLQAELPSTVVETTDAAGLAPEWIEAAAFAWLAMRRVNGLSGNLPAVTGARRFAALGSMVLARASH